MTSRWSRFRGSQRSRDSSEDVYKPRDRIIDRLGPMSSSKYGVNLDRRADKETWAQILELFYQDIFHVVLVQRSWTIIICVTVVYTLMLLLFAGLYKAESQKNEGCAMNSNPTEPISLQAAFGFSLYTAATIGFNTIDGTSSFFINCPGFPLIVCAQVLSFMMLFGMLVGIIYQRIGRADARSKRVIFSRKAVIKEVDGRLYFAFQVYDLEKRVPLVEAHCRVYANFFVDAEKSTQLQTQYIRIEYPDDDNNATLFLALPAPIMHEIDFFSPFIPPALLQKYYAANGDNYIHSHMNRKIFPGYLNRDVDCQTGSSDHIPCPVCGNTFYSDELLVRHIKYNAKFEKRNVSSSENISDDERNEASTAKSLDMFRDKASRNAKFNHINLNENLVKTRNLNPRELKLDTLAIMSHIEESSMEIIVVVEGIEPSTSGTFQARASYKSSDIVFDHWFKPCVTANLHGDTVVNLNDFNDLIRISKTRTNV